MAVNEIFSLYKMAPLLIVAVSVRENYNLNWKAEATLTCKMSWILLECYLKP